MNGNWYHGVCRRATVGISSKEGQICPSTYSFKHAHVSSDGLIKGASTCQDKQSLLNENSMLKVRLEAAEQNARHPGVISYYNKYIAELNLKLTQLQALNSPELDLKCLKKFLIKSQTDTSELATLELRTVKSHNCIAKQLNCNLKLEKELSRNDSALKSLQAKVLTLSNSSSQLAKETQFLSSKLKEQERIQGQMQVLLNKLRPQHLISSRGKDLLSLPNLGAPQLLERLRKRLELLQDLKHIDLCNLVSMHLNSLYSSSSESQKTMKTYASQMKPLKAAKSIASMSTAFLTPGALSPSTFSL